MSNSPGPCLLSDYHSTRLAVLNACEGARSGVSDPFAGVAQSLIQQGLPAVVAMQFMISDEAALIFAREFYGAIEDGYPIEAALADARGAIRDEGNPTEWGTPVLYSRAPDGYLFDLATRLAATTAAGQSNTAGSRPSEWDAQVIASEWGVVSRASHSDTRVAPKAGPILPFYLVCEESASMAGEPIKAINDSLPEVHSEIGSNPALADHTRFCLIGYSDEAHVLQPLIDLSSVASLPGLRASGGVSYAPAFDLLYETINQDVEMLLSQGRLVYRPAVFFLTGSQPDDDWTASLRRLTDPRWRLHPNILAFGFGNARKRI
jgi:uncharacterized protein YegL